MAGTPKKTILVYFDREKTVAQCKVARKLVCIFVLHKIRAVLSALFIVEGIPLKEQGKVRTRRIAHGKSTDEVLVLRGILEMLIRECLGVQLWKQHQTVPCS